MLRTLQRSLPQLRRAVPCSTSVQRRFFFNDGYADNTSLETIYKVMIRTPEVRRKLLEHLGRTSDSPSFANLSETSSKQKLRVVLPPELGDPHRVLLQYSFTVDDPIEVGIDGCPVFEVDFGEERQKIKLIDAKLVEFLARTLLKTLDKDPSPHGAKQYLDSLVGMTDEEFDASQVIEEAPATRHPLEETYYQDHKFPAGFFSHLGHDADHPSESDRHQEVLARVSSKN